MRERPLKKTWLIALLCGLLAGCAQPRTATLDSPTDGAVIVRLLANFQGVSSFAPLWNKLEVDQISAQDEWHDRPYELTAVPHQSSRTRVFAGSLPPGLYKLVRFSSPTGVVQVNQNFSRFEVKSGQLTDLGPLIQSSIGMRAVFAHGGPADPKETEEFVHELAPGLAGLLAAPVLSWHRATVPSNMSKLYERSNQDSMGVTAVSATGNNEFIYGSSDGVVYSWTPGERARPHDIQARTYIASTLVTHEGSWLAGGEFGVLQQSDNYGTTWHSVRGNLPFAEVVSLNQWHDQVIATLWRFGDVYVYRRTGDKAWAQAAHYVMDVSPMFTPGIMPKSILKGDQLFTTLPDDKKLSVIDLAGGEPALYTLPGKPVDYTITSDGVSRCWCSGGFTSNPSISRDDGKTWQPLEGEEPAAMPIFKNGKQGIQSTQSFSAANHPTYTDDGGKTWIPGTFTATPGHYFAPKTFFYTRDLKLAYGISDMDDFWVSSDDGRSWAELKQ